MNHFKKIYKQRVDKYAQENTKRIEAWYEYADTSIKERVYQGIQNLINIGFSDKDTIKSRIYEHYSTGSDMDPRHFIFNFQFFYDNHLEDDFELMQQELIDLTPPELWDDIDMPNETLMESLIPILESAVKKIERQYPELDSVPKVLLKRNTLS